MTRPPSAPAREPRGLRMLSHSVDGRVLLMLLVFKAAILVLNAATYPSSRQYDASHHAWRARSAGLEVGKMAYNSPIYYLPVLPAVDLARFYRHGKPVQDVPTPRKESSANYRLLTFLKWTNVAYVLGAYLIWIVGILPRFARTREVWLLSSILLLAMPGFQKAAVMAHPDVLLLFMASLTFYLTSLWMDRKPSFWRNLTLAVLAGLTGACRPFAIVPLLACWALNLGMLMDDAHSERERGSRKLWSVFGRLAGKVVVVTLISATLAGGWWAFRFRHTGELTNAYNDTYMAPFQPLKKAFDFKHYYTTFYFTDLLQSPSRADIGVRPSLAPTKANSFWTQLYSEFWGDHYLYFSGDRNGTESKLWVKRILFVTALPLTLLFLFGLAAGTFQSVRQAIRGRMLMHPHLFAAGIFWLGFALFMYWQGSAGLLPGKNSTIKFLYIAWLVPFGIATAAAQPIGRAMFWLLLALEVAVTLAASPMSQAWA